jgi:membrane-associated phospholipid phosphatase
MTTITTDGTRNHQLAKRLSQVFHPCTISIPSLLLAIYLETGKFLQAILWVSVFVAAFLIPFLLFIAMMVKKGRYSDLDVSIREQRHGLYVIAGVSLLLLLGTFTLGGAPPVGRACAYAAVVGTTLSAIFNIFSKISVHAMTTAGCAAVLFHQSPFIGLALAIASALVGWSRVYLRRHTWTQVICGWSMATICVVIVFRITLS